MEEMDFVPVVSVTIIRRLRRVGDRFVAEESPALVWDPEIVRMLLDEREFRHPVVATIAPDATE